MRYIERILQPGETVLYQGRIHWVIYFPAVFLLLSAIWVLFLSTHMQSGSPVALICLIAAVALALAASVMMFAAWFRRWTTELDVTNQRVVNKRGFITRHTIEMNMDKIESVDVDQSILGRILNYGNITIRGTGAGWDPICTIARPLEFRNHVTAR